MVTNVSSWQCIAPHTFLLVSSFLGKYNVYIMLYSNMFCFKYHTGHFETDRHIFSEFYLLKPFSYMFQRALYDVENRNVGTQHNTIRPHMKIINEKKYENHVYILTAPFQIFTRFITAKQHPSQFKNGNKRHVLK